MRICFSCMQQINDDKKNICPNCGESLIIGKTPPQFLRPGTVLQGKFIVGKSLGNGGFGNTYIGWNQVLSCRVAIKEYYPQSISVRSGDGVTVAVRDSKLANSFRKGLHQFLEEARSVANLQNVKGVVAISTFFEENGTGYIVMEYLEGMDVRAILKKAKKRPDYMWCRRVILTVLDTLRSIHRAGVLHRDIAPDNVFVTKEGVIKLIDFGAAKHATDLANLSGDIVLKQGYAPIEQYSRTAKQGPYTDIYAVAAMFYWMLTGKKPAPANERINQDTLVPPSGLGVSIPESAELAIMVCLNVQPPYRLQTAEEFIEALDGLDFVPVYEPEWILPLEPREKRGVAEKISSLPVGVKALLILAVLLLAGGAVAGTIAITSQQKAEQVADMGDMPVMDLTGQTYDEASKNLSAIGISKVAAPVYEFNTQVAENTVIAQSISPGTKVSGEEEVVLTVSGGKSRFTVQDCSQMTRDEARKFFSEKGVQVKVDEAYSDNIGKGKLVSQTISPGEVYVTGESPNPVGLVYSVGKRSDYEKKMPDLTGLSPAEAKKKLKKAGITIAMSKKTESDYNEDVSEGRVAEQYPEKGKKVNIREDKKIVITMSRGPKPTPKPTSQPKSTSLPKPKKNKNISSDNYYLLF